MSAIKSRIMYIQRGLTPGRIGRVRASKSGRTLYYGAIELVSSTQLAGKANHFDPATGDEYWVSGPRRDGQDTLYPGRVEIDDDVREEYWREIRELPGFVKTPAFRSVGVHAKHSTR